MNGKIAAGLAMTMGAKGEYIAGTFTDDKFTPRDEPVKTAHETKVMVTSTPAASEDYMRSTASKLAKAIQEGVLSGKHTGAWGDMLKPGDGLAHQDLADSVAHGFETFIEQKRAREQALEHELDQVVEEEAADATGYGAW
ncbi:MAG: hypothetical protein KI788_00610 [Mameliella sp.]|nr:hypothetical protein [Mameliella sp.]